MSIGTEHQNSRVSTQASATATASDLKGKGKEKEVDPPVHEDASDAEESGDDTRDDYPFERFPSPPRDESDATLPAVPNAAASLNPPLDPPLMTFTYPPPPPLANDPTWFAQMVAEVHRNRAHLNTQLGLAHAEASDALADVTLADIEQKAERDEMQKFLNRLAAVAGKNFVRKLIRSVHWALVNGDAALNEGSEDEHQDADDENSSRSDEGEVDQEDQEDDNLRGSAGESEEHPQDAEEDEYNDDGDSQKRSQSPSPSSPNWRRHSFHESLRSTANPQGTPETPPTNGRRKLPFQEILSQPSSPNSPQEDVDNTDDEYSGGGDASRGWTESPPAHESRKRQLEEEEESSSPETSPRKKIKLESQSPRTLVALPSRSVSAPEDNQDNAIGSDAADSDEEYDVENSLTIEHEPVLSAYSLHLYRLERNPYRVRQNSRGAPELYVPGRLAIDFP
ncbi:hypothetical protein DEU56DRAFT_782325 [Suillus clintonianus]|uniref:uncharacterized protein n=1 Tax=Suillus clintonianus TaxID=1904413 RepID=UPI001B85D6AF|nr:uncharacterized protein DEU56DRAFT_782325 [Suillus clintonianus]KAG2148810.1 hypothetical protein DEU56DRAFT_782325 [Suillus clintonianus]